MKFEVTNEINRTVEVLGGIEEQLKQAQKLDLSAFDPKRSALVFVDVIEGFVNIGMLSSDRAPAILPFLQKLKEKAQGFHKIYFADTHPESCPEFKTYPPHCVEGTKESELVEELKFDSQDGRSLLIPKNCTNGFLTQEFQTWLEQHPEVNHFIITGLVTDICVMQFALTLKAHFDQENQDAKLYVPIDCVETFELDQTAHMAQMMNLFALYNMQMNGIKIVRA